MSASNKLIEAIAENFTDVMTDILRHACEYGDDTTLNAVAEVLRDADYVVLVDNSAAELARQCPIADLLAAARQAISAAVRDNPNMKNHPGIVEDIEQLQFAIQGKVSA